MATADYTMTAIEAAWLDAGQYAAQQEATMIMCPKCEGNPDYEDYIEAVTVGEPQPGEYVPCELCHGLLRVTQGEADRWQAQWERDNAPPADTVRRTRSLFK